ncbi:type 2 lanthipeptide synthetase LanM family protein [Roseovarius sp. E0-M6]|uniref:type 2 lanthipeptide synthetase LanM family protein n=1 Tax=Roseovarius sp. E0-M6 TaxID=3127118 RepID=UPI00301036A2
MKRVEFVSRIACRSLTLQDHLLLDGLIFKDDASAHDMGRQRAARWQEIVTRSEAAAISRRLRLTGQDLSFEQIALRLRPVEKVPKAQQPDWANRCWRILSQICRLGYTFDRHETGDVPFGHLFEKFAVSETQSLLNDLEHDPCMLGPDAEYAIAKNLCLTLSNDLSKCLQHEFSRFRLATVPSLKRAETDQVAGVDLGTELYEKFLDALLDGNIYDLMIKFAAAARFATLSVDHWNHNMREMLARFAADRAALNSFAGSGTEYLRVEALEFGLGDPHNKGRSVTKVTVSNDRIFYYKPRDICMEAELCQLTQPLCTKMKSGGSLFPASLVRNGYGWVAHASTDIPELAPYYFDAGFVLAVAWALGGTDLHDENIVMSTSPVIVDGEMFASPIPESVSGAPIYRKNMTEFNTVLRSGLLPRWVSYEDGSDLLVNGLAGGRQQSTGMKQQRFVDVNTDDMRLVIEDLVVSSPNVAQAAKHEPSVYTSQLIEGFEACCSALRTLVETHGTDRFVSAFAGCTVRFLVRDTNIYAILQQRLRLPRYLLTLLDADIELEVLSSTFLASRETVEFWPLCVHEKEALLRGDIPYFTTSTNAHGWHADNNSVPRLFSKSGTDVIQERLCGMSPEGAHAQVGLIRASMHAAKPIHVDSACRDLESCALEIGSTLAALALGEDTLDWVAPQSCKRTGLFELATIGNDLYDGRSGIAVFLAALFAATGHRESGRLARCIYDQLLVGVSSRLPLQRDRGGCVGAGSIVYAFQTGARLLNTAEYYDAGRQLAAELTSVSVTNDAEVDWITGLSGEAAALLIYPEVLHSDYPSSVTRAISRALSSGKARHQSGAGHGLAGIILGLNRLRPVCADADAVMRTACNALRDTFWQPKIASWNPEKPDRSETLRSEVPEGWASGDAGILTMLAGLDLPEISLALDGFATSPLPEYDTLAAGAGASIDMWLQMQKPEQARKVAQSMVQRAGPLENFRTPGNKFLAPGLFDGLAGIGYSLLRAAYPLDLPSVLRLEGMHQ